MSMSHMSLSIYGQSLEGGAYRISGACLKEQHSMGIAYYNQGAFWKDAKSNRYGNTKKADANYGNYGNIRSSQRSWHVIELVIFGTHFKENSRNELLSQFGIKRV